MDDYQASLLSKKTDECIGRIKAKIRPSGKKQAQLQEAMKQSVQNSMSELQFHLKNAMSQNLVQVSEAYDKSLSTYLNWI